MINLRLQQRHFTKIAISGGVLLVAMLGQVLRNSLLPWTSSVASRIGRILYTTFFETFTIGEEFNSYRNVNIFIALFTILCFHSGLYIALIHIFHFSAKLTCNRDHGEDDKISVDISVTSPFREENGFYDSVASFRDEQNSQQLFASLEYSPPFATRKRVPIDFDAVSFASYHRSGVDQCVHQPTSQSTSVGNTLSPNIPSRSAPNIPIVRSHPENVLIRPNPIYPYSQEFWTNGLTDIDQPTTSSFSASQHLHHFSRLDTNARQGSQREAVVVPLEHTTAKPIFFGTYDIDIGNDKYATPLDVVQTKTVPNITKNSHPASKMNPINKAQPIARETNSKATPDRKRSTHPMATRTTKRKRRKPNHYDPSASKPTTNNNNKRYREAPGSVEVEMESEIQSRPSKRQRRMAARVRAERWAERTFGN